MHATLIENGFASANLKPSTFIATLRNEKKDHLVELIKSTDLINELFDKSLYLLLSDKSVSEM